jgi:hypothetical protein
MIIIYPSWNSQIINSTTLNLLQDIDHFYNKKQILMYDLVFQINYLL